MNSTRLAGNSSPIILILISILFLWGYPQAQAATAIESQPVVSQELAQELKAHTEIMVQETTYIYNTFSNPKTYTDPNALNLGRTKVIVGLAYNLMNTIKVVDEKLGLAADGIINYTIGDLMSDASKSKGETHALSATGLDYGLIEAAIADLIIAAVLNVGKELGFLFDRVNDALSNAHGGETPTEDCTNGNDDDGDGSVDCADSDCSGDPACAPATEVCNNTMDDDGDGLIDCDDTDDCANDAFCQVI